MKINQFTGSNTDAYTNRGRMEDIARRHNQKSIELNGAVTCVRRRKVSKDKYKPVHLL